MYLWDVYISEDSLGETLMYITCEMRCVTTASAARNNWALAVCVTGAIYMQYCLSNWQDHKYIKQVKLGEISNNIQIVKFSYIFYNPVWFRFLYFS